ncbi:hypothetical protein O6H91_20G056300 [Diphasiastrum complanatum]|uniref:Uncharacterized protein n=1 Tax=Diphasiastrum complanatum TaxID=34168 RepID=A0ACC2AQG5_DIPCM|nr:hypothetical protein O6H91_Y459900 [Diphasiastrum complanatum]KAJ7519805.1 hypothetical protein O6H91_20G056300 [Diphasiastrum complanatum]
MKIQPPSTIREFSDDRSHIVMRIPECPSCWKIFNDGTHAPRLLMCGHTVCEFCLEQLFLDSGAIERCFTCPECRSISRCSDTQDLPKNFAILRALKSAPCSSLTENSCGKSQNLWQRVPSKYFTSVLNLVTSRIPEVIERKVREVGNALGISSVLLFCAPLSFVHTCVSCFTAGLGFLVLSWSSIGGVGLGLGMLFLWWTRNLVMLLHRFARFLFRVRVRAQKAE